MNKEQFRAERLYLVSLSVAKSMLLRGIISQKEFAEMDAVLLKKYRPVLGTLLAGKSLAEIADQQDAQQQKGVALCKKSAE